MITKSKTTNDLHYDKQQTLKTRFKYCTVSLKVETYDKSLKDIRNKAEETKQKITSEEKVNKTMKNILGKNTEKRRDNGNNQ